MDSKLKSALDCDGIITSLAIREDRSHPVTGSSTFHGFPDCGYAEHTVSLVGTVEQEIDRDTFKKTFEIQWGGDMTSTFILKLESMHVCDTLFDSYELVGWRILPDIIYRESMSLATNNMLARSAYWMDEDPKPLNGFVTIPLMIRETVDYSKGILRLIENAPVGCCPMTHVVVIHGLKTREIADSCRLEVDYVYLDRLARQYIIQTPPKPTYICNYVSEIIRGIPVIDSRCECIPPEPIRRLSGITGLIIKPNMWTSTDYAGRPLPDMNIIHSVEVTLNGKTSHAWDLGDKVTSWRKVGLLEPKDGSLLIPFSHNMWKDVERAAIVDFSRIDNIILKFKVMPYAKTVEIEITALAYNIRK